jgi:hypothetical protein
VPDTARTFVQALKSKYAPDTGDLENPDVHIVFVSRPGANSRKRADPNTRFNQPIKFSGKVAEEVGFDKIRKQLAQLEKLTIVILDGLAMWRPEARRMGNEGSKLEGWISGAGDVIEACPKVVELDLSRNLFEEWREVASICEGLNSLNNLRVE